MIKPLCPIFGKCGGCAYQNLPYEKELALKQETLRKLITSINIPEDSIEPIVDSPLTYHYRNRLDLKLQRTRASGILMGFTPKDGYGIVEADECAIAAKPISEFLPQLHEQAVDRLPKEYRQANLVVRTGEDERVHWGGIGRKSNKLKREDYLWTEVHGRKVYYSLDTFFQANLSILPKLFERILSFDVWKDKPVFLDLYGGVGLFSFGVADHASWLFLIENDTASIRMARFNREEHSLKNLQVIEGRVEDHLEKLLSKLKDDVCVAMIDPPRSGLSKDARKFLARIESIEHMFYLSCNPKALVEDLKEFVEHGWEVDKVIPFDFFPKTIHLETLVFLKKKG